MPKTIRTKVYQFNELKPAAKQNAIAELSDINVDYEWWDGTYDDAATIGLKLTGFDLGRGRSITGDLKLSHKDVAKAIIENHGEVCSTHLLAKAFIDTLTVMEVTFTLSGKTDVDFIDEHDVAELEEEFEKDLLNAYWKILYDEYDYLQTEEAVKETIIANKYYFTVDGKKFAA